MVEDEGGGTFETANQGASLLGFRCTRVWMNPAVCPISELHGQSRKDNSIGRPLDGRAPAVQG